jgi:hypothetical protein
MDLRGAEVTKVGRAAGIGLAHAARAAVLGSSSMVMTCWHALTRRVALRSPARGTTSHARQEVRKTRKFQAVLTLLPAADGAEPASLAWPAWRAVVRARDHTTRAGELLTALVSTEDGGPPPGQPNVVVTMVVVGASPDNCLDVGDLFTLWRGRDIARGVISRRLYV